MTRKVQESLSLAMVATARSSNAKTYSSRRRNHITHGNGNQGAQIGYASGLMLAACLGLAVEQQLESILDWKILPIDLFGLPRLGIRTIS